MQPLSTLIIDDEKPAIQLLQDELESFNDIQVVGTTTKPQNGLNLIRKHSPDLVFLDVEMPNLTGFELLQMAKDENLANFKVIFHTAYDKYLLPALREAAFDFILKPIQYSEIKTVINRVKTHLKSNTSSLSDISRIIPDPDKVITLPTATGIRFLNKNQIVLFHYLKENTNNRPSWHALLNNGEEISLKKSITASEIIKNTGEHIFTKVNQNYILNIGYLNNIEFKTRRCILIPPYNNLCIIASRNSYNELRERFNLF